MLQAASSAMTSEAKRRGAHDQTCRCDGEETDKLSPLVLRDVGVERRRSNARSQHTPCAAVAQRDVEPDEVPARTHTLSRIPNITHDGVGDGSAARVENHT
eukprot:3470297-Rhodomonas_salina.1